MELNLGDAFADAKKLERENEETLRKLKEEDPELHEIALGMKEAVENGSHGRFHLDVKKWLENYRDGKHD